MACPKGVKKQPREKQYALKNEVQADKREKTLWKWFSQFVRLRDCYTGELGRGRCVSCGIELHYKEGDAGHYVRSRHKAVKFDEHNVHLQCVHCNQHLNGNEAEHRVAMVNMYGEEEVQRIECQKGVIVKRPLYEVEAMLAEYKQKAKDEAFRVGVPIR